VIAAELDDLDGTHELPEPSAPLPIAVPVSESETLAMQIPMALREPPNVGDAMDVRNWLSRLAESLRDGGSVHGVEVYLFWSDVLKATPGLFATVYGELLDAVVESPWGSRVEGVAEAMNAKPFALPRTLDECRRVIGLTADLLRYLRK
jgi:hypothetical protein